MLDSESQILQAGIEGFLTLALGGPARLCGLIAASVEASSLEPLDEAAVTGCRFACLTLLGSSGAGAISAGLFLQGSTQ